MRNSKISKVSENEKGCKAMKLRSKTGDAREACPHG